MPDLNAAIFKPLPLKRCLLPNRLIRSATYEGLADRQGYPQKALAGLYLNLIRPEPGTIITGFVAVSPQGRAMHPNQGGLWDDSHIRPWREIVTAVKAAGPDSRLFMQLAHTGRQTVAALTGQEVVGASSRRCTYFQQKVHALSEPEIEAVINDFAAAAERARAAGLDGVQIHAAHGYLIHQFLSPHTNTRDDRWRDGGLLLAEIIRAVRARCGKDFPLLIKVSHADDRGLRLEPLIQALKRIEDQFDAAEVSYDTMEYALNIIRGGCPIDEILRINPIYKTIPARFKSIWKACVYPFKKLKFKDFTYGYNLEGTSAIKKALKIPVIPVGGLHRLADLADCLGQHGFEAAALCRPFICEPDLLAKIKAGQWIRSRCSRCNLCTINCDSLKVLTCHQKSGAAV